MGDSILACGERGAWGKKGCERLLYNLSLSCLLLNLGPQKVSLKSRSFQSALHWVAHPGRSFKSFNWSSIIEDIYATCVAEVVLQLM